MPCGAQTRGCGLTETSSILSSGLAAPTPISLLGRGFRRLRRFARRTTEDDHAEHVARERIRSGRRRDSRNGYRANTPCCRPRPSIGRGRWLCRNQHRAGADRNCTLEPVDRPVDCEARRLCRCQQQQQRLRHGQIRPVWQPDPRHDGYPSKWPRDRAVQPSLEFPDEFRTGLQHPVGLHELLAAPVSGRGRHGGQRPPLRCRNGNPAERVARGKRRRRQPEQRWRRRFHVADPV